MLLLAASLAMPALAAPPANEAARPSGTAAPNIISIREMRKAGVLAIPDRDASRQQFFQVK